MVADSREDVAVRHTAFVLLMDAPNGASVDASYQNLTERLERASREILGFRPCIRWAPLSDQSGRMGRPAPARADGGVAERCFEQLVREGAQQLFVLPISFDFGMQHKQWLTEQARLMRRTHPELSLHYDAMQASHPLLLQALVDSACKSLARMQLRAPSELGLLLIAKGTGDPDTRAESYRLMRLVWEQLGAARGEVAFVRHTVLPLPETLGECARTGLTWVGVPQFLWPCDELEYARVIFDDSKRLFEQPGWQLAEPCGGHSNIEAWLTQRIVELYRAERTRRAARLPSLKRSAAPAGRAYGAKSSIELAAWDPGAPATRFGPAVVAEVHSAAELAKVLGKAFEDNQHYLVKPTWHGYATGTYTDAVALDMLLSAASGSAIVLEAHTASKNSGDISIDWETEARNHRSWIREQEQQYLQKTGLLEAMQRHRASYVNITEHYWDGRCVPAERVRAFLEERGVSLRFEELLAYVPEVLFELRGSTLLSYARFKGPTRLSLSNLFGLLPEPLRAAWHGPNITYFAQVCCDLAKLYGTLFELYGLVESLSYAVRWERRGLYRSRWGNYDLIETPGVVCFARGPVAADVLAARLQGQDVARSAFFDVVQSELGFEQDLANAPLPEELTRRFL